MCLVAHACVFLSTLPGDAGARSCLEGLFGDALAASLVDEVAVDGAVCFCGAAGFCGVCVREIERERAREREGSSSECV